MGLGDLFKSKTERAMQKALNPTKDNITRVKALDHLEEQAKAGDDQCLQSLIKCFHITVKKDQQEQSLAPYDDEAEKKGLIERLAGFDDPRRVIKHLRKELATPPWLTPGRRDGVVFMIELLGELAEAASESAAAKRTVSSTSLRNGTIASAALAASCRPTARTSSTLRSGLR